MVTVYICHTKKAIEKCKLSFALIMNDVGFLDQ